MSHENIPAGLDQGVHQVAEFRRTHNNSHIINFGFLCQELLDYSLEIFTLRFTCQGWPPAGLADTSRIIPYHMVVLVLQQSSEYLQNPLS